jgi:two-component system alkaline phosphatase synthesis response regulator PhoP
MTSKILICDDEPYIRLLIEQTLEELEEQGVEIITASNGAEALEIVEGKKPGLVFLDVMMPRVNGFEVCRIIKFDLQMKDVYVVILTAKGQTIDRSLGEQVGADSYMTKPFDPDEMVNLAKRVLGL